MNHRSHYLTLELKVLLESEEGFCSSFDVLGLDILVECDEGGFIFGSES